MAKITYIGEADEVEAFGVVFQRGKAVDVPSDNPGLAKIKANQMFADTAAELKAFKADDKA